MIEEAQKDMLFKCFITGAQKAPNWDDKARKKILITCPDHSLEIQSMTLLCRTRSAKKKGGNSWRQQAIIR